MSYEDKIVDLVKQFEGEDKLGFIKSIELDYNKTFEFKRDRYSKSNDDEDKVKETNSKYLQVSVRFTKSRDSFSSYRIQTKQVPSLKMVYLQLQEYLKLEMQKKEIDNRLMENKVQEETIADAPRDLQKELNQAIVDEDYEKAREIQNEIDFKKSSK